MFVCSGNTCRSPLAAAITSRLLAERGLAVAVASAGLAATAGQPAAREAEAVAGRLGLSLREHRARPVGDVRDGPGVLWLTMTPDQAAALRQRLGAAAQIEALLPYVRAFAATQADDAVPDPFGRGEAAYEEVARTLTAALTALADGWSAARGPAAGSGAPRVKTLALPRLDGLRPTLESTALKLLEEAGELAEVIGKYRALSGERREHPPSQVMTSIGQELLDVAQTAITMMFVLEEQHGVDLQGLLQQHVQKLAVKGYLEPAAGRAEA